MRRVRARRIPSRCKRRKLLKSLGGEKSRVMHGPLGVTNRYHFTVTGVTLRHKSTVLENRLIRDYLCLRSFLALGVAQTHT